MTNRGSEAVAVERDRWLPLRETEEPEIQRPLRKYRFVGVLGIAACMTFICTCGSVSKREHKPSPRTEAFLEKSIESQRNHQEEKALDLINQAIEIDPQYAILYIHKAAILHSIEKHDEAIETLKTLVRINPIAETYAGLGVNLDKYGRTVEALGNYRKALQAYDLRLKRNPSDSNARANRAFILFMMGYGQEARGQINDMLRKNPNDHEARTIQITLDAYPNKQALLDDIY